MLRKVGLAKRRKRKTTPKLNIGPRKIQEEVILERGNQRLWRKVWIPKSIMDNYRQIAANALWIPKIFFIIMKLTFLNV